MTPMSHETMPEVLQRAVDTFKEYFEQPPNIAARAPGRVNLVGDHADASLGMVLSLAIDRNVMMVGRINHSQRCRVVAADLGEEMANFMNTGDLDRSRSLWVNLVKGIVAEFNVNGHRVPSFDAVITSKVPVGAGLAGSTAVQVATVTFIETMMGIRLGPLRKAQWSLHAREVFTERPGSIVDALTCSAAIRKHAMRVDSRSHAFEHVPLNRADISILVTDSGLRRDDDPTAIRRGEIAEATEIVRHHAPHVQTLRDTTLTQVEQLRGELGPTLTARARHVILESQRVMMVADALSREDYETVGFLMHESHRSLRDEFEVSCDELNTLVESAMKHKGVLGARMTGPGLGGCSVTLVRTEQLEALSDHLRREYKKAHDAECTCHPVIPVAGAKSVPIVPKFGQ